MTSFPKLDFHIPAMPKINPPELILNNIEPKSLPYEDTVFKKQADDIKSSFESQITALENIARSAQKQADSASQQIEVLKEQLAFAKAESNGAQKDALFSKITAIIAIIISIAAIIVPQI